LTNAFSADMGQGGWGRITSPVFGQKLNVNGQSS
jgi:hypothetical protein